MARRRVRHWHAVYLECCSPLHARVWHATAHVAFHSSLLGLRRATHRPPHAPPLPAPRLRLYFTNNGGGPSHGWRGGGEWPPTGLRSFQVEVATPRGFAQYPGACTGARGFPRFFFCLARVNQVFMPKDTARSRVTRVGFELGAEKQGARSLATHNRKRGFFHRDAPRTRGTGRLPSSHWEVE